MHVPRGDHQLLRTYGIKAHAEAAAACPSNRVVIPLGRRQLSRVQFRGSGERFLSCGKKQKTAKLLNGQVQQDVLWSVYIVEPIGGFCFSPDFDSGGF